MPNFLRAKISPLKVVHSSSVTFTLTILNYINHEDISFLFLVLVGAPIPVSKRPEPTPIEVQRLHEIYVRRLKELFDRYEGEYSDYPDANLEVK